MDHIEEYKLLFGCELKSFIDGVISFEEFGNRISKDDLHHCIKNDEIVKLAWHAIYQYETDINTKDHEYAEAIVNKMRQISSALINSDPRVYKYLDHYFNSPYIKE